MFYGSEFNLKTLSCLTLFENDCANWCQGLAYLVDDVRRASNRLHQVNTALEFFLDFLFIANFTIIGAMAAEMLLRPRGPLGQGLQRHRAAGP